LKNEKNIPAVENRTLAPPRIPRAHGNRERPEGPGRAPREGAEATLRSGAVLVSNSKTLRLVSPVFFVQSP
jgi:hypothetical protein